MQTDPTAFQAMWHVRVSRSRSGNPVASDPCHENNTLEFSVADGTKWFTDELRGADFVPETSLLTVVCQKVLAASISNFFTIRADFQLIFLENSFFDRDWSTSNIRSVSQSTCDRNFLQCYVQRAIQSVFSVAVSGRSKISLVLRQACNRKVVQCHVQRPIENLFTVTSRVRSKFMSVTVFVGLKIEHRHGLREIKTV